jgi:hypothetical protein
MQTWTETESNMEPLAHDDPRYIARRLFKELCALYPDRYIALIEEPPLLTAPVPPKPITL